MKSRQDKRTRRRNRIRAKISGTAARPRLSVFKSNRALYAQLIDDERGVTIAAVSSVGAAGKRPLEKGQELGRQLAELARRGHVTAAVFDRGGYRYAGAVKALSEGAREGGLQF